MWPVSHMRRQIAHYLGKLGALGFGVTLCRIPEPGPSGAPDSHAASSHTSRWTLADPRWLGVVPTLSVSGAASLAVSVCATAESPPGGADAEQGVRSRRATSALRSLRWLGSWGRVMSVYVGSTG